MKFSEMTAAVLESLQLTEAQLAERVGCRQPTINRIKSGRQQPGYLIGTAIRQIYEQCPQRDERAA